MVPVKGFTGGGRNVYKNKSHQTEKNVNGKYHPKHSPQGISLNMLQDFIIFQKMDRIKFKTWSSKIKLL